MIIDDEKYIADGEIHILNKYYAYAFKIFEHGQVIDLSAENFILTDQISFLNKKYLEYTKCVDPEDLFLGKEKFSPQIIFRPLNTDQPGSLAIKFLRLPNDEKYFERKTNGG